MWGRPFNYIKPVPKPGYRQVHVFHEVCFGNTEFKRTIDGKIMRSHMQKILELVVPAKVGHRFEISFKQDRFRVCVVWVGGKLYFKFIQLF